MFKEKLWKSLNACTCTGPSTVSALEVGMLGLGLGLGGWNPVPAGRSAVWILYTVMESPEGAAKERWGAAACDVTWKAAVLFLCTLIDVTLGNTRGSGMILEGGQTAATPSTRLQPGRRDGSRQQRRGYGWEMNAKWSETGNQNKGRRRLRHVENKTETHLTLGQICACAIHLWTARCVVYSSPWGTRH